MTREQIIEILKDHELKRTDGVHQVMISGIFPELYDKLAEAIELKLSLTQQDEPSVSEWVSVEERLPEDDLFVIVWYGEADSFGIASYKDETWCESFRGWVFEDMVTHWKELYNKPPKTEK